MEDKYPNFFTSQQGQLRDILNGWFSGRMSGSCPPGVTRLVICHSGASSCPVSHSLPWPGFPDGLPHDLLAVKSGSASGDNQVKTGLVSLPDDSTPFPAKVRFHLPPPCQSLLRWIAGSGEAIFTHHDSEYLVMQGSGVM